MKTKEQILDAVKELITKSEHDKDTIELKIVRRSKNNLSTLLSILAKVTLTDLSQIKNTELDKDPMLRDPALDIVCDNIDYDIIFYTEKTELVIVREKNIIQDYGNTSHIQTTEPVITVNSPIVNISDFAALNGLSTACVLDDVLNLKYIDVNVYLDNFRLPITSFPCSVPYSFSVECDPCRSFSIRMHDKIQSFKDIVSFSVTVYEDRVIYTPIIWLDRNNNNTNINRNVILSVEDGIVFLREILTSSHLKIKKGSVLMTVETGINYDFFKQE